MANLETVHPKPADGYWTPLSGKERAEVRAQLERILQAPQFRVSRRYPRLLRHVVEQALEGRIEGLKERTLGVEVFGRDPAYDTNADPVVRMTAGQVRRRLAEYYQTSGREAEIQIELPVGSYVPVFRRHSQPEEGARPAPPAEAAPEAPAFQEAPAVAVSRGRAVWYWTAAAALVVIAGTWMALMTAARHSALEKFWGPVWEASDSVLICVARGLRPQASGDPLAPATALDVMRLNRIAWADSQTLARLSAFLAANGKRSMPRTAEETSFTQLRAGPAILIGGYNNPWIMRLTSQLRFSYERDAGSTVCYIQDRQDRSRRQWAVDTRGPLSSFTEDFGIVMRYFDPTAQQHVVVASGIAYYGTLASGEFLTDPKLMETLAQSAPHGWEGKNLQVVFSTRIINGETGRPTILATHFW